MKHKWINDKVTEMKRLFAWGLLICLCLTANATDLLFNLTEFNAFPTNNRTIQFQAQTPFVGNNQFITSTADGTVTNFNVKLGVLYNYVIKAPPANIVFQIYVPSDTANVLLDATNFTAIGQSAATYPSGQVAPSVDFADNRYQRNGSSASNSFYPSSNPSNYITVAPVNLSSNYLSTNINANINSSSNAIQGQFQYFVQNNGGLGTNNVFKDTQTYGNSSFIGFLGNIDHILTQITASKSNVVTWEESISNRVGFLFVTNSGAFSGTLTLNGIAVLTNATSVITNGLATTNWVGANFYPTSNPSSFVTSSITNGLASIQLVNTNSVNSTNFTYLIGFQGTNNLMVASNNLSLLILSSTNSSVTQAQLTAGTNAVVAFSATNSINLTNYINLIGLQGTNNSIVISNGLAALIISSTNNLGFVPTNRWIDTNVWLTKLAYTNSINLTNYVNSSTNSAAATALALANAATNNMGIGSGLMAFTTTNYWSSLIQTTNIIAQNSIANINGNGTNINAWSNLSIGGLPAVYLSTTNVVGVWGAGVAVANGTYTIISAEIYTNTSGNGSDISFSNPTWFIDTNNVHLYSASSLVNGTTWNNVVGSSQVPSASYGYTNNQVGIVQANVTAPSNSASAVYVNFTSNAIVTNLWSFQGNSVASGAFIGTTNNAPLILVANGTNVLVATTSSNGVSWIGGIGNQIAINATNAAIFSGTSNYISRQATSNPLDGKGNIIVGGTGNTNLSVGYGFIGDGINNLFTSAEFETILNGATNTVQSVLWGTIINGQNNTVSGNNSRFESIINGKNNTVVADYGLIGDGVGNLITSGGLYDFLGNGVGNVMTGWYGFIGSGTTNAIGSSLGFNNAILGGVGNSIGGQFSSSTFIVGSQNRVTAIDQFGIQVGEMALGWYNTINYAGNTSEGGSIAIGTSNSLTGQYDIAIGKSITSSKDWTFIANDTIPVTAMTNAQAILSFSNGVCINTNWAGTNALRVYGYIDSEGFTIHGVPFTGNSTNGLATTNWVGQNFYPTSNPSAFVTASVTNGLSAYADLTNELIRTNWLLVSLINTNSVNGSNTLYSIGANDTNFSFLIGLKGTNNTILTSNGLAALIIASTNSLANLTQLASGTNAAVAHADLVGLNVTNFVLTASNNIYIAGTNAPASQSAFNATNNMAGLMAWVQTNKYLTTNDNGQFLTSLRASQVVGTVFDLTNAAKNATNTISALALVGQVPFANLDNAITNNQPMSSLGGGIGGQIGIQSKLIFAISNSGNFASGFLNSQGGGDIVLDSQSGNLILSTDYGLFDGNVGINNPNPAASLDVNGSAIIGGNLDVSGDVSASTITSLGGFFGNGNGVTNILQSSIIGLTNSLVQITNYVNSRLIGVTNLTPYNVLVNSDIGTNSIWQLNTNIISVQGAAGTNAFAYVNGLYTYTVLGNKWTNSLNGFYITNNIAAAKYNLLSGSTVLYQTPTLNPSSWTTISGIAPPPNNIGQSYGVLGDFAINGVVLTNLPPPTVPFNINGMVGTNALFLTNSDDPLIEGNYNWGATGYVLDPSYTENFFYSATPVPHWEIFDYVYSFDFTKPLFTNSSATVTAAYRVTQNGIDTGYSIPPTVALASPEPIVLNPSSVKGFLGEFDAVSLGNGQKIFSVNVDPAFYIVNQILPGPSGMVLIYQNDSANPGYVDIVSGDTSLKNNLGLEYAATNYLFNGGNINCQSGFFYHGSGENFATFSATNVATLGSHIPVAVTVATTKFSFTNKTPNNLECYFSSSSTYSVTKNAVPVFQLLVGDSYLVLQPNSVCVITNTVAPSMFTNAW